ncbi:MAG: ABC transporter substrate-binding protein [Deltaproteobacteria bacterium]|nr:ABC transporter substrate-binding protein [Deltaproteobacteria bacterium]MDH3773472.1 ABC transporter substrate-binding protein [Deltaproteobacteria bacterium]MDH3800914.1 ABC transporter substrate-binding protein [Deltaproteobacteria bacterium]MDH3849712.1 ABC transporter substrate-binding protein [Deltaproteobacteria bacterium]MDH3899131.1 ABC transporter substrate-binding protein [Deltaproteobacteria bacterium]
MNTWRKILVLLCAITIAFSWGCGKKEEPVSKEPIKIGAFFALSGPAAFIGAPTQLVAEMVVDKINKEGGINGHPLELVIGDTESDPTKAIMVAKRLVENEKVVALIGPTRTGTGMAVKKYLESKQIPTVMTVGGDPVIMEGVHGGKNFGTAKFIFKSPQRSSIAVKKIYLYLQANGYRKVALITASDGFGRDGKRWLTKLAAQYGLEIVADESFEPKDADMTTQLTKIKSTDAQVIVCWTIGPAGSIVAKNVKQLAVKLPLVQCHGLPDPKYIELAGSASEGNVMPSTKLMAADQLPKADPQRQLIADFVHLYNEVYDYDKQFPINAHSGYAWDAIYILANAMKKVGTDPVKLRAAIEQTTDYVGISGIYNITPEDHNGLDTDSMIIVQIEKGQWNLVY